MPLKCQKAGLIFGSLEHHLDHLAPFCSLHQMPLVLTDEELLEKARLYYPELEILFWNCALAPIEVVKNFDTIFYSTPRILFDEVFYIAQASLQKKIKTIWLPHGNSDKGHASYFMEGLKDEKAALVYGPKMIDFLKTKQVYHQIPQVLEVGNFRLTYYLKHKAFYDKLVPSLPEKKVILYAPTWQDAENSSSFFEVTSHLIEQLPTDSFLLIKLHPNLVQDVRTQQMILQQENNPSVLFLQGFPPIYPLLEKSHLYLGDMSSIGYDFLYFNRPMFFFNPTQRDLQDPGLYLHRCGRTIASDSYANIYDLIEQDGPQSHLAELRKQTYEYTFGNCEVKLLDI